MSNPANCDCCRELLEKKDLEMLEARREHDLLVSKLLATIFELSQKLIDAHALVMPPQYHHATQDE